MREIHTVRNVDDTVAELSSASTMLNNTLSMLWPLVNNLARLLDHFGIPSYTGGGGFRFIEDFDTGWHVDDPFAGFFVEDFENGSWS